MFIEGVRSNQEASGPELLVASFPQEHMYPGSRSGVVVVSYQICGPDINQLRFPLISKPPQYVSLRIRRCLPNDMMYHEPKIHVEH